MAIIWVFVLGGGKNPGTANPGNETEINIEQPVMPAEQPPAPPASQYINKSRA